MGLWRQDGRRHSTEFPDFTMARSSVVDQRASSSPLIFFRTKVGDMLEMLGLLPVRGWPRPSFQSVPVIAHVVRSVAKYACRKQLRDRRAVDHYFTHHLFRVS